jgi:hypothetical protein
MKHTSKTDYGMVERQPRFIRDVICKVLIVGSSTFKSFLIQKGVDRMYLLEISYASVSRDVSDEKAAADPVCIAAGAHRSNSNLRTAEYC